MPALIFDFDGVIMDSEPVHERTIRAAAESAGLRLTHEDFVRVCVGSADAECLVRLARDQGRELSEADLARMVDIKRSMFAELREAGEIRPFAGTVALIRAAAADPRIAGMAVCTGSRRAEAEAQLRGAGLRVAAVCHTLPRETLEAAGAHAVFSGTDAISLDDLLAVG